MKTYTERLVFSRLSDEAKAKLVEETVRWGHTIWHSNADALRGYLMEKKSLETYFYSLRTEDGTLVGSSTVKFYRVDYNGEDIVIVKLALGVNPEHRGNKFALRCLMSELLHWKVRHPRQPLYIFSTLIHPVTYKLCCDLLGDDLYPYFENPVNPERHKMLTFLTERFGVEKSDTPSPYVYKELFSAKETQEVNDYWRTNQRPEVRFFIEHCPNYYNSDDCLICLAPIRLTHVFSHMVRTLVRNQIDKVRGRKHKFASGESTRSSAE
jgi:hypothetical protein